MRSLPDIPRDVKVKVVLLIAPAEVVAADLCSCGCCPACLARVRVHFATFPGPERAVRELRRQDAERAARGQGHRKAAWAVRSGWQQADREGRAHGLPGDARKGEVPPDELLSVGPHDFTLADLETVNEWNAAAADAELASQVERDAAALAWLLGRQEAEEELNAWLDAIEAGRAEEDGRDWNEAEVRRAGQNTGLKVD